MVACGAALTNPDQAPGGAGPSGGRRRSAVSVRYGAGPVTIGSGFLGTRRPLSLFVLIAGLSGRFHRADQHMGIAAFQPRLAFDRAVGVEVASQPHEQLLAQIGVSDLAAAKLHNCLNAIALLQKANRVLLLEI